MNAEKLQNHMAVLKERHDALDKMITEHYNQYMDDTKLKEKKLKKLEILNEIERCKHQLENLN